MEVKVQQEVIIYKCDACGKEVEKGQLHKCEVATCGKENCMQCSILLVKDNKPAYLCRSHVASVIDPLLTLEAPSGE